MSTLRHPDWHWIARQVFRKRALVKVTYQWFDAKPYVVLSDRVMGSHLRLSGAAEQFWQAIDGRRSIQAVWDFLRARNERAPSQDDLVQWVVQLMQHGLLLSDHPVDADALQKRHERRSHAQIEQRFASPLAVKTSLFDPHRLTLFLWPLVGWIFSKVGAVFFVILLLAGMISGVMYGPQFIASADEQLLSQNGLLMLVLCYPLMKLIHEFAHCWMVYRFGGQVREFGIMWLVLFPVPYVEASDATSFEDKGARMLVGGAGIMAEAGMAAIAMLIWPWIEPGMVRAFLYQVILIGTVSTLLFNGNPLLKFDAYFVLSDWLEVPNLAKRSTDYFREGLFLLLAGIRRTEAVNAREATIFRIYGPLSLGYRVVLTFTIAWLAMSWFYALGVAIALWAVLTGVAWPFLKSVHTGFRQASRQNLFKMALIRMSIWVGVLGIFGFGLPLPFSAAGQGQWLVNEDALIVAEGSGPVSTVWVNNGQSVKVDTPLLRLQDPELSGRVQALSISQKFLKESLERGGLSANERAQLDQQLVLTNRTATDFAERIDALTVRAKQSGQLQWSGGRAPYLGAFITRGDVLGSVVSSAAMELVLAFPAHFSGRDISGSSFVGRLVDGREISLTVVRSRVVDIGGPLPQSVLRSQGGRVAEDPGNPGRSLEPVWLIWAKSNQDMTAYLGTRVDARLGLGEMSLFAQWAFHLRQLFVRALRV